MIHGRQVMQGVAPSKEEACEACVTAASQTNTWTNYCQCFVTNSNKSSQLCLIRRRMKNE